MTQEEKELLLKDLSGRLPFGVKIEITWWAIDEGTFDNTTLEPDHIEELLNDEYGYTDIRPYLRPMSSMTEKEIVEINSMGFAYWTTMINNDLRTRGPMSLLDAIITHHKMVKLIDWLNAHHFDYRGLIPMGLALESPKDMYD